MTVIITIDFLRGGPEDDDGTGVAEVLEVEAREDEVAAACDTRRTTFGRRR